jgi:hypothetical protein
VARLYPLALGSLYIVSYVSPLTTCRATVELSNLPPTWRARSSPKSKSRYDQRSVNQYVLVSSPRGYRGAPSERISIRHQEGGILRRNLSCYHWEGFMWSMQFNVELGTNSAFALGPRKTVENLARVGWSQDLPNANWLLASSPALNTRALTLVPICTFFLFFPSFHWKHLQVVITKTLSAYNLDKHQTVYNTCGRNECI